MGILLSSQAALQIQRAAEQAASANCNRGCGPGTNGGTTGSRSRTIPPPVTPTQSELHGPPPSPRTIGNQRGDCNPMVPPNSQQVARGGVTGGKRQTIPPEDFLTGPINPHQQNPLTIPPASQKATLLNPTGQQPCPPCGNYDAGYAQPAPGSPYVPLGPSANEVYNQGQIDAVNGQPPLSQDPMYQAGYHFYPQEFVRPRAGQAYNRAVVRQSNLRPRSNLRTRKVQVGTGF
jgi:hypothetical protein